MVNKDVATLSQWLQCFMMCIHQYSVHIFYKAGPELYIVDWLPYHNHAENRDQEILDIIMSIHMINTSVDIPICMFIEGLKAAMKEDKELQYLKRT